MTYRDMLEVLSGLSPMELQQDATIFLSGNQECHPIEGFDTWNSHKMDNSTLDEGHCFFWAIA